MIEYSGRAYSCLSDTVTGRLSFADCVHEGRQIGAKILIWDGQSEIGESIMENAVGIVIPEGVDVHAAQKLASLYRIPTLTLPNTFSELGERVSNKIAILDPTKEKLYVNPDLETVCSLLGEKRKETGISRLAVCDGVCTVPEGFDGLVVKLARSFEMTEEEMYDDLCDIADRNTGARIVAVVTMDEREDTFASHVRAVYRAGVWGRFSLLCRGVNTPEHTDRCITVLHSVFRELDEGGREFNGFIPKGIVIDTPAQLLKGRRMGAFDIHCFDIDTLVYRFCVSNDVKRHLEMLTGYIEDLIRHTGTGTAALMSRTDIPSAFTDRLLQLGARAEIYTENKNI